MLTRHQLEPQARREGISLAAVERDYLQHLFLRQLSSDLLRFKGGTCLRIAYGSPRYSDDLDFSSDAKASDVREVLSRAASRLSDYGVNAQLSEDPVRAGVSGVLLFEGPLYIGKPVSRGSIRLEVSLRKETLAEESVFVPRTPYPDVPQLVLRILRRDLLFAEKIRAMLIRAKPRDLFDVHYLITHDVTTTLEAINERLSLYHVALSEELVEHGLASARRDWDRDLGVLLGQVPPVDLIAGEVRTKLFALLAEDGPEE